MSGWPEDDIRLALEGAEFFACHYEPLIAKSTRLQAAITFAKESADRRSRLAEMARRSVELAPAEERLCSDDLIDFLAHVVGAKDGLEAAGRSRDQVALTTYYRNLETEIPAGPPTAESKSLLQIAKAERMAQQYLERSHASYPPVDPYEVAGAHGVLVAEREVEGCDGCILIEGDAAAILVNSSVASAERRRFTAAHELGHYALHQATMRFRSELLREMESESSSGRKLKRMPSPRSFSCRPS